MPIFHDKYLRTFTYKLNFNNHKKKNGKVFYLSLSLSRKKDFSLFLKTEILLSLKNNTFISLTFFSKENFSHIFFFFFNQTPSSLTALPYDQKINEK
jgi:hypothetical protein